MAGNELGRRLARSAVARAARSIDAVNEAAGRLASWLGLALLAVVVAGVVLYGR